MRRVSALPNLSAVLRSSIRASVLALVCLASVASSARGTTAAAADHLARRAFLPVLARHGMVVAQEGTAAKIGVEILRRGGNAVDAAVATGLALAVTLPRAGNLGGGGFMLIHLAKEKKTIVIDYREAAPADTPRDVFLDEAGEAVAARVARQRPCRGRAGNRRRPYARACTTYGSGKFSFGRACRARRRTRPLRHRRRGGSCRFASPRARPAATLAVDGADFSASRRHRARARRQARSNRSRRRSGSDRPRWRARLSTKARLRKKSSRVSARPAAG